MVDAERQFTDEKFKQIIALKRQVCTQENGHTFVIINQKSIDPLSLDMLAKEGILGLRRVKRRIPKNQVQLRPTFSTCFCVLTANQILETRGLSIVDLCKNEKTSQQPAKNTF